MKPDINDLLRNGGEQAVRDRLSRAELFIVDEPTRDGAAQPVSLDDFYAYMPAHRYIFAPTRQLWPGASVNARIPSTKMGTDDNGKPIKASAWLDRNQPVEQMTWAPGQPMLIRDCLIAEGGWIDRPGSTVFNLYRPPLWLPGDPSKAKPWRDHLAYVYPDDADHIEKWLAHRVQRPAEKVNHALLLGGAPGIGKDTILHPVRAAIGDWNMEEVTPVQLLGRFNGFIKSVILRINEARDLGEVNRYSFYEHLKPLIAAPPDTLRCDEKNLREYRVPNVCGIIITSNYKTDGVYLPADDRRHYVAWSHLTAQDFGAGYFEELYAWFEREGCRHVTAYLSALSLASFNAKAPPPKTSAFWEIVDANCGSEESDLADIVDNMRKQIAVNNQGEPVYGDDNDAGYTRDGYPKVLTLQDVTFQAPDDEVRAKLRDPRNRRVIPKRFEKVGYVRVLNDDADDKLWKIGGRRQAVYGRFDVSLRDRLAAVRERISRGARR